MKKGRRWLSLLLIMALVFSLVGCGEEKEQEKQKESAASVAKGALTADSTVVAVGNLKVSYQEYQMYSYLLQSKYDNMLTSDVWNYTIEEGKTMGTEAIEEIVRLIIQLKVISKAAAAQKIAVAVDEREDIAYQVEQFLASVPEEDKQKYGINSKLLADVLVDNELARMMYDIVTGKVDVNVTDEQARVAKVQMIHFMSKGTDKNGEKINLDAEKKTALYETALSVLQEAKKTGNFHALAEEHSARTQIDFDLGLEDSPAEVVQTALSMKAGQVSEVIGSEDGFYILNCISVDDANALKQHREELILERQTKAFQDSYAGWAAGYEVRISKSLLGEELIQ